LADDRAEPGDRRRGRLRRHVHVSTAYVAGRFHGIFKETDLDLGQGFRNTYEQSKFEAEKAIGEAAGELPLVIARPSIIVGDSRKRLDIGVQRDLLADAGVLARTDGRGRDRPRRRRRHRPVDYVADGLMALLADETIGGTVALVAGPRPRPTPS
jgi:hypothetical protein